MKDVLRSFISSVYYKRSLAVSHVQPNDQDVFCVSLITRDGSNADNGSSLEIKVRDFSRRTGYRKWEVLDPSLPTLGWVEVIVGWEILFLA